MAAPGPFPLESVASSHPTAGTARVFTVDASEGHGSAISQAGFRHHFFHVVAAGHSRVAVVDDLGNRNRCSGIVRVCPVDPLEEGGEVLVGEQPRALHPLPCQFEGRSAPICARDAVAKSHER